MKSFSYRQACRRKTESFGYGQLNNGNGTKKEVLPDVGRTSFLKSISGLFLMWLVKNDVSVLFDDQQQAHFELALRSNAVEALFIETEAFAGL